MKEVLKFHFGDIFHASLQNINTLHQAMWCIELYEEKNTGALVWNSDALFYILGAKLQSIPEYFCDCCIDFMCMMGCKYAPLLLLVLMWVLGQLPTG